MRRGATETATATTTTTLLKQALWSYNPTVTSALPSLRRPSPPPYPASASSLTNETIALTGLRQCGGGGGGGCRGGGCQLGRGGSSFVAARRRRRQQRSAKRGGSAVEVVVAGAAAAATQRWQSGGGGGSFAAAALRQASGGNGRSPLTFVASVVAVAVSVAVAWRWRWRWRWQFAWLASVGSIHSARFAWLASGSGYAHGPGQRWGGVMAVGSRCALAAQGEDGGGQRSSLRLARVATCAGRSLEGAAALASLALLGLRSWAMVGCWG